MEPRGVRVLMISSDRLILKAGSAVSERMKEYGNLVGELRIILFSDKKHGLKKTQLASNIWVYPTNSSNKFARPLDVIRLGREIDCDLITAQDPFECGWAGMKIKKAKNVPLEVQLHTDPFSRNFSGILNVIRKLIMGGVLKKADGARVVLRSVADRLIEEYGLDKNRVSVLPIYIDRKRISNELFFDLHEQYGFKSVALMVSRLEPEKNISMAIKALAGVPDIGLVIVGIGSEEEGLRALARKLGIESRVAFAGWQDDLSGFYRTSDIFIQTSRFEGYGISLVEAGVSGLPVISTPVGIARDLKNVIIAETADRLARALKDLAGDPEKRKEKGIAIQKELEAEILTRETFLVRLKENWQKLAAKSS